MRPTQCRRLGPTRSWSSGAQWGDCRLIAIKGPEPLLLNLNGGFGGPQAGDDGHARALHIPDSSSQALHIVPLGLQQTALMFQFVPQAALIAHFFNFELLHEGVPLRGRQVRLHVGLCHHFCVRTAQRLLPLWLAYLARPSPKVRSFGSQSFRLRAWQVFTSSSLFLLLLSACLFALS